MALSRGGGDPKTRRYGSKRIAGREGFGDRRGLLVGADRTDAAAHQFQPSRAASSAYKVSCDGICPRAKRDGRFKGKFLATGLMRQGESNSRRISFGSFNGSGSAPAATIPDLLIDDRIVRDMKRAAHRAARRAQRSFLPEWFS